MERGIRLQNICCVRGGRELFAGLSLALDPGEALMLTGPNGAGKSSLLRIMAGLLGVTAGTVQRAGSLGLVDGRDALDREATVANALGFWARIDGGGDLAGALSAMGIGHLASVPVRMLSSGQRQRAALARLIVSGADIWLLDEPSNALDSAGVAQLEAACAAHVERGGIVAAASHLSLTLPNAQRLELGT
jgi:heme exporter protein A